MDSVYIFCLGDLDDLLNIKVSVDRPFLRVQLIGLVGLGAEESVFIFLGKDGNRGDTQLVQCTENADGNLAAVGNHDFFKLAY